MSEFFELNNSVNLTVNGGDTQAVEIAAGTTLAAFVRQHASAAGIRTFSVYVDGQKMTTEQGNLDISHAQSIEIVAKDSRGSN